MASNSYTVHVHIHSLMKAAVGCRNVWITVSVFWLVQRIDRYVHIHACFHLSYKCSCVCGSGNAGKSIYVCVCICSAHDGGMPNMLCLRDRYKWIDVVWGISSLCVDHYWRTSIQRFRRSKVVCHLLHICWAFDCTRPIVTLETSWLVIGIVDFKHVKGFAHTGQWLRFSID